MMGFRKNLGRAANILRAVAVLNAMLTLSVTSGEESSQQVMYVTGCLGSSSVMLHAMTSADDIRAVFVYKGGEILGSDIIPAQEDYKGRLQISRQGAVTLSDLRLWDSGVFRIELTMRDSKKSTYVVLVVPEAPSFQHSQLQVSRVLSSSHRDLVRLTCGTFTSLGYPAASVLWLDPDGRLLSSTGYMNGQYILDLPPSSPPGNYSCLLHCSQPHSCCLPPASPLSQPASIHLPRPARATVTSQPTPELTSTLEKVGENMAAAMAALVNEQVQDSYESNRLQMQVWREELEDRMEKKVEEISMRLEKVLEDRLEEIGGIQNIIDARGAEVGASVFEKDVYSKMKNSIQILYQQMDESRHNMSRFQKKINNRINSFQRKLKSLRLNMKRYGVFNHERTIKNLKDSMNDQFQDINDKFRDFEASNQPSDDLLRTVQLKLNDMNNKLTQGEVSLGSFQRSLTHKMEDLREMVVSLEDRLQRHQMDHRTSDRTRDQSETDDSINDTKSVLGRPDRPEVSQENDPPFAERRPYAGAENGDSAYPSNIPVSETCVSAMKKGGTVTGVYTLRPDVRLDPQPFWCDMHTEGGGWIVFQRRQNGSEDFYRPWDDYVNGFGDPKGDFWLGLETLHLITTGTRHSLRVDLINYDDVEGYAFYQTFRVLGAHHKYLMTLSGYFGSAGDGLFAHDNKAFSAWNKDNDEWQDGHCAANYRSAWWYAKCRVSDLNAPYSRQADGIMWLYGDDLWGAGKIRLVEMKIRPEQ